MGYNLPDNNVPDNGSASVASGPHRPDLASCGAPALPGRSALAEALRAPLLFALVVADVEEAEVEDMASWLGEGEDVPVEDVPDVDSSEEPEDEVAGGDGRPGEVVVWGLAFPSRAVVFLHNPLTGRDDFGLFGSPERARRFYSLFGELDLVYV